MEHYNRRHRKEKGSMKLEHKAGQELMVDFAGKHLFVTDRATGEQTPAEVFVSILPCSQYTYVEACKSQKREDMIPCIGGAFQYYGGVSRAIVSDNLKSAVSRASKYEPQINKSLKDFARHYGCAVNPTRTYSPQDKALVEHAVNLVYQRIYYPMRNMTFFSLKELNKEILRLLEGFNDLLFQRKEASRRELFQSIERSELKPLPAEAYELKEYRRAKVQKMGYVYASIDKNYYSVPYRFIGVHTQVHSSSSWVEVYYNNERIAVHPRVKSPGVYTTIETHLSSSHQAYKSWSPAYFKTMATKHGEAVMQVVDHILNQSEYPEIAYKRVMGIIQLHKSYSSERLNNACQRALYGDALSYTRIKNILKNSMDMEELNPHQLTQTISHIPAHENIRGSNSYN
jgi:transposase